MFGMECVADDVETWDCEAVGLVVIDVCLLKANVPLADIDWGSQHSSEPATLEAAGH